MPKLKQVVPWIIAVVVAPLVLNLVIIIGFSLLKPAPAQVDAVIILGAKVGTPALTERTLQGLTYVETNKTDTIVLSGGQGNGEPIAEAEAMRDVVKHHVAQTGGIMPKLILDTTSTNTYENIRNSKKLLPQAKSVLVVSDCFHLARSVIVAKRAGFQNVSWDAPAPSYYRPWELAYYYLREAIGLVSYLPRFISG